MALFKFKPSAEKAAEKARWREFKKIADRVPKLYKYLDKKMLVRGEATHPVTGARYTTACAGNAPPDDVILYNHLISRLKAERYRAALNYVNQRRWSMLTAFAEKRLCETQRN